MKKLLVLLLSLSMSYGANAEDIYSSSTGNLHMPSVNVDGTSTYEVDMEHKGDLNFQVKKASRVTTSTTGKTIEGNVIRLTYSSGKVAAELYIHEQGYPELRMFDTSGNERIAISAANDGASVNLRNQSGKTKVSLAQMNDGRTLLTMFDESGNVTYQVP